MKPQVLLWILSVMLSIMLGGAIAWNTYVPHGEVRITEEKLQTYLDSYLPQRGAGVVVDTAKLQCANNQLSTSISLHTNEFAGYAYAVQVLVNGYPRYEPQKGSFYLDPTEVTVTSTLTTPNEKLRTVLSSVLHSSFLPIKDVVALVSQAAPKVDELVRMLIRGTILTTLQKMPVYQLPADLTGATAAIFLQDITVVDGEIVFGLTLARIGMLLGIAFLSILLTIGILLPQTRRPVLMSSVALWCLFGL